MSEVEKEIEVNLPVRAVYNQWTLFEEFPRFMEGVQRVEQLGPDRLHWVARIGGRRREWDARILDQIPDQRVAWRSENGEPNAGLVTFQPSNGNSTRVRLRMQYRPEGLIETAADAMGIVSRRVEGDLTRFKRYLEGIGHEAGGWRGEIHEEPVSATEPPPLPQETQERRSPLAGAMAGAMMLAATVGAGYLVWRWLARRRGPAQEPKRRLRKAWSSGTGAVGDRLSRTRDRFMR